MYKLKVRPSSSAHNLPITHVNETLNPPPCVHSPLPQTSPTISDVVQLNVGSSCCGSRFQTWRVVQSFFFSCCNERCRFHWEVVILHPELQSCKQIVFEAFVTFYVVCICMSWAVRKTSLFFQVRNLIQLQYHPPLTGFKKLNHHFGSRRKRFCQSQDLKSLKELRREKSSERLIEMIRAQNI